MRKGDTDIILASAGRPVALVADVFPRSSDVWHSRFGTGPGTAGPSGIAGLNRTVYRDAFMALLIGFVPAPLLLSAVATIRPAASRWC